METILNWYLIGCVVNFVIVILTLVYDKVKYNRNFNFKNKLDVETLIFALIGSWIFLTFCILSVSLGYYVKNKRNKELSR